MNIGAQLISRNHIKFAINLRWLPWQLSYLELAVKARVHDFANGKRGLFRMGDKLDLGWRILLSCTVPAVRLMMIAVVMMAAVMMAAVMMAAMGGLPRILRVVRAVVRLVVRRLMRLVVRRWLRRLIVASLVVAAMAWLVATLVMTTVVAVMGWVVAAVMGWVMAAVVASVVAGMAWVVAAVVTTVVFGDGCVRIAIALVRHRTMVALNAFIARMLRMLMVVLSTIEILVERCGSGADKQSQGELHHL